MYYEGECKEQLVDDSDKCEDYKAICVKKEDEECTEYTTADITGRVCELIKKNDEYCLYDKEKSSCDTLTLEDGATCGDQGVNIHTCLVVTGYDDEAYRPCFWDDESTKCLDFTDEQFSTLTCADPFNKIGCISITNPT